MNIYIKNMVCIRCKMIVKKILDELELPFIKIELGFVELRNILSIEEKKKLNLLLMPWSLYLMNDPKEILTEKIKNCVTQMVLDNMIVSSIKTSYYLSKILNYNYTYLANVFYQVTGQYLSDFIVFNKIEKVKEMLTYDNLNISEIAWKMNYSSVSHLSNQFVKVTGIRPSQFKKNVEFSFVSLNNNEQLLAV